MSEPNSRLLVPLPDFESAEASLYFAQLEDLSRRLWDAVGDADPAELQWQPAPGTNSLGMLLAHIPIAEVFWISVLTESAFQCQQVLGIGGDDDGMPLPPGGAPPPALAEKSIAFYRELHLRGRERTCLALVRRSNSDLTREIEHRGRTQKVMLNGRWILYHLVEHLAGHCGQIGLVRHLYRLRPQT